MDVKTFAERIVRLEEEKAQHAEDIKAVYQEAADEGFDKAILRKLVRLLMMEPDKRHLELTQLDLYSRQCGFSLNGEPVE